MVETESHNREHKSGMARIWAAAIGPWLRLRRKIAEVGPLYAAQLLFEQLVPQFLFRINMFVMIEGDPNKRGPSSDRDPEIRWTSLPELGALSAPERAMEDLRIGLENGERGAIFERGGALIGYILYATDAVDEGDWMRFRLAPEDIWNSVAWVAPGHRGQGIHASLRNFAVAGLLGEGYTRILANIDALNRNSLSATWKVGAWDIGRFFFVRILGFTFVRAPGLTRVGWWGRRRQLEIPTELFYRPTSRR